MGHAVTGEYDELLRLLADVYNPDGVRIWLDSCHKEFSGLTVAEMEAAGRMDEVLAAVERLATGAFG